ncbi:MAG: sel1 repeat family protein [Alphaproteobacteria bacterium]|nr:sel1 repeat family protein [Alphaproteobacteria bacterium]
MPPKAFPMFAIMFALSACSMPDMQTGNRAVKNQDYAAARANYEPLAEFGIPKAKTELGKMYLYGRGADANPQKALALFEEAQAKGDPGAAKLIPKTQAHIGALALTENPSIPPQEGLKLLHEAAASGDASALFNLGYAHEKGIGVPANGQVADQYYQQASAQDYPKADFYRGQLYQRGELIPKNMDLALQLYELAAQNGYARGYLELGKIYEKGTDVPQDYQKAKNYYTLAKQNGLSTDGNLERLQGKSG